MDVDRNVCIRMKNLVPYPIYCIQHRKYNWTHNRIDFSFFKQDRFNNTTIPFKVIADIQNDVYRCLYGTTSIEYGVLYIPDIKTSVMMNKLYRNIKENYNLDALEESDDEDDFEITDEDKYLLKGKEYIIECSYNNKFNKWYPVRLSKSKMCVGNIHEIKQVENSYKQKPITHRPATHRPKKNVV